MSVAAVVGGTVVTPDGPRQADVLISDGKIARLADTGAADTGAAEGRRVDAAGCYVLPGGVDPHCHLMSQVRLATAAAARGGTTTVLSFTNPEPGQGDLDCLLSRRAEVAGGDAVVDVGLHAMLYDPEHITFADLAAARRAGAAAIKVFLAYPELGIMCSQRRLFELMTDARRLGLLVQVHCESGPLIEALVARALQADAVQADAVQADAVQADAVQADAVQAGVAPAGTAQAGTAQAGTVPADALSSGLRGARLFSDTRPPAVEEEAVASTLAVASLTGAPCYLVHLSSAGAIEQVRLARARRQSAIYAEICLHHLLLDDHRYAGADAGRYLVAPPLRPREHVEAMWEAVADGTVDAVGSDHCQQRSAVTGSLAAAAQGCEYGIAGVGARLPLLLSEGLARGVPIGRLVQLGAENPARIFGHYPRKGVLAPGSDADIVVFDPAGQTEVGPDAFDDGTGPTVYAGQRLRGQVRAVLLRGRLIVSDGMLAEQRSHGRYLPRPEAHATPAA